MHSADCGEPGCGEWHTCREAMGDATVLVYLDSRSQLCHDGTFMCGDCACGPEPTIADEHLLFRLRETKRWFTSTLGNE